MKHEIVAHYKDVHEIVAHYKDVHAVHLMLRTLTKFKFCRLYGYSIARYTDNYKVYKAVFMVNCDAISK